MFLVPMLMYVYVARPATYAINESIGVLFRSEPQLLLAQFIQILGLSCFCFGILRGTPFSLSRPNRSLSGLPEVSRHKLLGLALVLGGIGVIGFLISIFTVGGFDVAYSQAKGGGYTGSGYVRELPHLTIPAIALLFLARKKQGFALEDWVLLALFCFPFAVSGILGTRRGPLFMVLGAVIFSHMLFSRRRISLTKMLPAVGLMGISVLFVFAHRSVIYLNSDFEFSLDSLAEVIAPSKRVSRDRIDSSSVWLISTATIVAANQSHVHHWGQRWGVILFIRPIPKQLWPTKYEDVGFEWMVNGRSFEGISPQYWYRSVGWLPPVGSAISFIADAYLELWYFYTLLLYLMGRMFAELWKRARTLSGLWAVIYVVSAAISIFLVAQSVEAFFFRFLFISILTIAAARFAGIPIQITTAKQESPVNSSNLQQVRF
ncbi:hypothetical protein [Bythopirellula polymerisocia]|nr:hypothetical protein [Bythopirellula polymerisocia]